MGRFDDDMWDLDANSISHPTLHRPRSSKNNTINGLVMNLFNAQATGGKKRSKTIHVYGMNNDKVGYDFLDIIARSKLNSKESARAPLQEKDLNSTRPECPKTIDLLDMDLFLSTQSQNTIPIEDGIDLLQSGHTNPKNLTGLEPDTYNGCEMEDLQSQISTVTLDAQEIPAKRSQTMPVMDSKAKDGSSRLTKSAEHAGVDEEPVADSEDEPELLSTTASSQTRRNSRSSIEYDIYQNHTLDTSILFGQDKMIEDDDATEIIASESQLSNANIEAEDFFRDKSDVFGIEHEPNEKLNETIRYVEEEQHKYQLRPLPTTITQSIKPSVTTNNVNSHTTLLTNLCNKVNDRIIDDESLETETEYTKNTAKQEIHNAPAAIIPSSYPSFTDRKRKPSLADICSKTNRARLAPRVGLSKKIKVDSLHDYLKK